MVRGRVAVPPLAAAVTWPPADSTLEGGHQQGGQSKGGQEQGAKSGSGQEQGAQSQLEGAQSLLEGAQLSLETETPRLSSLVSVLPSLNSLSSLPQPEVCRSTPAPVWRVKSRLKPYRGLSPCLMTCARQ